MEPRGRRAVVRGPRGGHGEPPRAIEVQARPMGVMTRSGPRDPAGSGGHVNCRISGVDGVDAGQALATTL